MNAKNKGTQISLNSLKNDLPAGLVVFLVALPLCLGIALASGAPLFSGIIAGIVGGIVVGIVSGSTLGVSGPAAGLTTIVLASIAALKPEWAGMNLNPADFPAEAARLGITLGEYEAQMESLRTVTGFQLFLAAVVLSGVIQILLGVMKAGIIGYYFPSSVIKGMLAAIGLILILKQIPHALGFDKDIVGDEEFLQKDKHNTFSELYYAVRYHNTGAVIISILSPINLLRINRNFTTNF